jgi:serine/threonine-protein kinase
MEYVEGNSCANTRRAAPASRAHYDSITRSCRRLNRAPRPRLASRIKPANIIIMSSRISWPTSASAGQSPIAAHHRHHGTPGYIAPEHYLGGQIDHRIDIFAAGVLFYHLLARQAPFRGRPEAIMHDVCYHDPEPASEADPSHRWTQYDPIVARALEKAPADRYQTAGAFRAAILAE